MVPECSRSSPELIADRGMLRSHCAAFWLVPWPLIGLFKGWLDFSCNRAGPATTLCLPTGHQPLSLELLDFFRTHGEEFFPGFWRCFKLSSSFVWALLPSSRRPFFVIHRLCYTTDIYIYFFLIATQSWWHPDSKSIQAVKCISGLDWCRAPWKCSKLLWILDGQVRWLTNDWFSEPPDSLGNCWTVLCHAHK